MFIVFRQHGELFNGMIISVVYSSGTHWSRCSTNKPSLLMLCKHATLCIHSVNNDSSALYMRCFSIVNITISLNKFTVLALYSNGHNPEAIWSLIKLHVFNKCGLFWALPRRGSSCNNNISSHPIQTIYENDFKLNYLLFSDNVLYPNSVFPVPEFS